MEWKKERKVRKEEEEEEEGKLERSLGRRKATSIHNNTNKITTTTTPTTTTTAESLVLPFLGLRVANRLQVDFANVGGVDPPLSPFHEKKDEYKLRLKKKFALFCFRRSNLHNNSITTTNNTTTNTTRNWHGKSLWRPT